jgi:Trp operon repressor
MLSTAIELLEATKSSVFDEDIMALAGELHTRRNELSDEIFARYLFMYSSAVASKVADSITKVLLTETEMSDLIATIDEMENLSETILEENE